jgi:oligoendopeptidase F
MSAIRSVLSLPALVLVLAAGPALPAQAGSKVPDYSGTDRSQVPEAFKVRISDIYPTPEAWAKELADLQKDLAGLEPLAKGWTGSAKAMADLLDWRSAYQQRLYRLNAYASLQSDLDLADSRAQAMKGQAQDLAVTLGARLTFLEPEVLALGQAQVDAYLKAEPRLAVYQVGLQRILRMKDHVLPAVAERVAALAASFTDAPGTASGILNDVDLPRPTITLASGEKVTLNTATYEKLRGSSNLSDRRQVMEAYWTGQKGFENTQAVLMDANVKSHLFDARAHGYSSCLEASLYPNAIDTAVYHNLVDTLRANLAPLHRLLRLRKRMLGLTEMHYGDIYASPVASVDRVFTYDEAMDLVRKATAPLGPRYAAALDTALRNRWVDVYPNKGKQSGAYSTDNSYGFHPFIKMNFDGTYLGVSTLAHELGHSMHSFHSDSAQPFPTANYPTFLAEIASTFNENLLMRQLLAGKSDDAFKLYVLDRYVEQLRGTLYRQGLFADFELAMHERVEKGQSLTPDWLDRTYLDLTRLYYGHDAGVVKVDDYIQCEWSVIPHFYMDFYVYQYSTSMAASMALTDAVLKEGEPARARYIKFLEAGSSRFPLDTLRTAGVDFNTPKPLADALKSFDQLVAEMETIYARMEKSRR